MTTEVLVGIGAGVPSFLLGFLAYRRSVRVDKIAAQANVTSESRAGTAQVIEGLNKIIDGLNGLIDILQEERTDLRGEVQQLVGRLRACVSEGERLKKLAADQSEHGE